jgi:hypothetical protein
MFRLRSASLTADGLSRTAAQQAVPADVLMLSRYRACCYARSFGVAAAATIRRAPLKPDPLACEPGGIMILDAIELAWSWTGLAPEEVLRANSFGNMKPW